MKIITVPLHPELHEGLSAYANAAGIKPAEAAKKLIVEMLDLYEDQALAKLTEGREKNSRKRVSHAKAWKV